MPRAKSRDYVGTWDGGFIRREADGSHVYVIRRMVHGRKFKVSTRCHSVRAAMEQLKRFESDPENYNPAGDPAQRPVMLDEDLARKFLVWSRDEKKNSRGWLEKQRRYLAWWADELAGLDLRTGTGPSRCSLTAHILPALEGTPGRLHRIAILKAFYSWMRKVEHVISIADDPTFQTLVAPAAKPAQLQLSKVIPKSDYLAARKHLAGHWRDALDVQAATGWHISETMRFASAGRVEPYPRASPGIAGVLVCPQTKSGEPLKTAVSKLGLDAARRLLRRGVLGREKYGMAVKAACRAAKVKPFTPGRFRHSVATWAIENGADPAAVAAFLNHKSAQTTKRFYATHAVPTKVPTLR